MPDGDNHPWLGKPSPFTMSGTRFDTLALHAGAAPDPTTGARATPIHLTTSFVFRDSEHAASLFNMERAGHVYSRISNPTVAVFEERVAALENGAGAIATASGQAALHLAVATLMGAGSHIVASTALYGGSHNLLHYTLRRFGIETTFVNPRDIDAWRAAIRPETKLLFGETLGNPGLDVLDIATVAQIGQDTAFRCWWTPRSPRPTCCARSTTAPGCSTTRPPSSWAATARRSAACWSKAARSISRPRAASRNCPSRTRASTTWCSPRKARWRHFCCARGAGLRDFGACMNPMAAWQLLQGIETLPLRMSRHVDNTRRVVQFLASHPMVESVAYPNSNRTRTTNWPSACCRAAAARCSASTSRPTAPPASASSKACRCSRTWPTWAMRARW
jgi:O-acetylhomoserine (thiol)-lyase